MEVTLHVQLLMAVRLLVAAALGAAIGLEREIRGRDAGLRTFALVSMGACLFSVISDLVFKTDNTRIAAGVVTGIGFLSAGVILQSKRHIGGLTTSATMWAAAGVGMAVGFGLWLLGTLATVLIIGILLLRLAPGEAGRHRLRSNGSAEDKPPNGNGS